MHNKLAFFYVYAKLDAIILYQPISVNNPVIFRLLNVIIMNTDQCLFCPWLALKWHLEFAWLYNLCQLDYPGE